MAATGTIALNANSLTVTGSGTKFTTEAQVGGALVTYIGNVPYTFVIDSIASDTALNLTTIYQGSNVAGQSFSLLDRGAYTGVNAELGARTALAIRKANYDKINWQQLLTVDGDVTVKVDDYSQYTGPSWLSLYKSLSGINSSIDEINNALDEKANTNDVLSKADNLASVASKSSARANLGVNFTHSQANSANARMYHYDDSGLLIITRRFNISASGSTSTAWSWNWKSELGLSFTSYPGISVNGMGGNSGDWSVGTESVTTDGASGFIKNSNTNTLGIWITITVEGTKA